MGCLSVSWPRTFFLANKTLHSSGSFGTYDSFLVSTISVGILPALCVLFAEFAYNNNYHTSAKMSPFEVLYGRKCRTLVTWDSLVDRLRLGPYLLMDLEQLITKV